jgi:WD40 repeat protein/F0F1-type ATP synthase epsilon subunit
METDTLTSTKKLQNPFPGLRAFRPDESYLFFGREVQVQEVTQKLIKNRFVSVIGPSGIGKSSFIYCGLFPTLHDKNPADNELEWKISNMQPGEAPLQNLLDALGVPEDTTEYSQISTQLRQEFEENPHNRLIFVDQFEELFRFENINKSNHTSSEQFVQLLLDLTAQAEVPIYVVITMRSDFIGNCSRYPNFTKKINDSQFLIPFMTREEKRAAIKGPIEYMNAEIEDELVKKVLDDVEEIPDQLPLMQHALMRTWNEWQQHRNRDSTIKVYHYESIGGIAQALSVHANEAYNELPPEQRNICAKIFRTITEITNDGRRVRRPAQVKEIAHEVDTSEAEVMAIVEPFRRKDRGLLMPPEEEPLNGDSIVDISHESLIRVWTTLQTWVEEEAESVKLYLRLAEDAEKHQKGQAGLWTNPDLEIALDWRNKQKPTKAWGTRYHPTYDRTMWFLESSKEAHEQLLVNKEQKRLRDRRRDNFIFRFIIAALIFAIILAGFAWQQSQEATRQGKLALEKGEIARKSAIEAKKAAEDAKREAKKAKAAEDDAKVKTKEAILQRGIAEIQKEKARLSAEAAVIAEGIARAKAEEARTAEEKAKKEAKIAEMNKELAEIEKQLAQLAREEADKLRLLSIASTMAIKSLELPQSDQDEKERKALIAEQAYRFHKRSGGDPSNPEIYNGLYYALKALKGDQYNQLIAHGANVRGLVSKQGNQIYSAGSDGKIILWDSQSHQIIQSIKQDSIHRALAMSPSQNWLACVGNYSGVQLFANGNLQVAPKKIKLEQAAIGQVWYVTFIDNQRLIFADEGGNINLADVQIGTSRVIQPQQGQINAIASSEGIVVYALGNQVVLLTGDYTQKQAFPISGLSTIISLALSDDARFLAVGDANGMVQVYDVQRKSQKGILKGHFARVNQMAFSKDGSKLATGSFDQTVRIWNIREKKDFDRPPIILKDHKDWVWSITFNADGSQLLAGCRDNLVRAWPTDLETMSSQICPELTRNMSKKEWERFVATLQNKEDDKSNTKNQGKTGSTIYYEKTCNQYGLGEEITKDDLEPIKK